MARIYTWCFSLMISSAIASAVEYSSNSLSIQQVESPFDLYSRPSTMRGRSMRIIIIYPQIFSAGSLALGLGFTNWKRSGEDNGSTSLVDSLNSMSFVGRKYHNCPAPLFSKKCNIQVGRQRELYVSLLVCRGLMTTISSSTLPSTRDPKATSSSTLCAYEVFGLYRTNGYQKKSVEF